MPRARPRWPLSKSLPRPSGRDRGRSGPWQAHRDLVCRRGAGRAEEHDHPPLGAAWHPSRRAEGPAHGLGLHLRCDLPRCTSEGMSLHLAEIAQAVAPGAHAVVLLDQAGWHQSKRLVIPANITLLPLPAKAPELNPVENVWQFLRDNWLSNRIFASYEAILDHCCAAWNKFTDHPWRIMSIGLRDWAHVGADQ